MYSFEQQSHHRTAYAELEQFCLDILRKHILSFEQKPVDTLAHDAITTWQEKFTLTELARR
jgi:hypothetical protein